VNRLVVDCCVAAKWFLDEEHTPAAREVLKGPFELHAPDLLLLEFDNLVCKRVRRKEISARAGDRLRAALRRMPVHIHSFVPLLDPAYAAAVASGCALYDCLYLVLAELLDAGLVTADQRFFRGARGTVLGKRLLWVADDLKSIQ
jgi:predicted nucleic acid-binding protein